MIDFIKDAGMALVWLLPGYFIGESNARKDKKITKDQRAVNHDKSELETSIGRVTVWANGATARI